MFSGPGYLRLLPRRSVIDHHSYDSVVEMVHKGIKIIQKTTNLDTYFPLILSLLYNAYTEKRLSRWLREHGNYGFQNLYADSGGLQVVTLGRKINEGVRHRVYKAQSISDYAMCFDVIPCVKSNPSCGLTDSIRSRVSPNLYVPNKAKDCAIITADYIIEQIEYLTNMGSAAKIFYIIQGNSINEMVEWFREGTKRLKEWHWDHIGGLAMAGTCMGPGLLESIETIVAYHKIHEEFGDFYTKNHIHLLGFGCLERLLPVLYLTNSGMLNSSVYISTDSTTIARGYIMGSLMGPEGVSIKKKPFESKKIIRSLIDFLFPLYQEYYPNKDKETIINAVFQDYLKPSKEVLEHEDEELSPIISASKTLTTAGTILSLSRKLREIQREIKNDVSPIGHLQNVSDFNQYKEWRKLFSHKVSSKKFPRMDSSSLDAFFS